MAGRLPPLELGRLGGGSAPTTPMASMATAADRPMSATDDPPAEETSAPERAAAVQPPARLAAPQAEPRAAVLSVGSSLSDDEKALDSQDAAAVPASPSAIPAHLLPQVRSDPLSRTASMMDRAQFHVSSPRASLRHRSISKARDAPQESAFAPSENTEAFSRAQPGSAPAGGNSPKVDSRMGPAASAAAAVASAAHAAAGAGPAGVGGAASVGSGGGDAPHASSTTQAVMIGGEVRLPQSLRTMGATQIQFEREDGTLVDIALLGYELLWQDSSEYEHLAEVLRTQQLDICAEELHNFHHLYQGCIVHARRMRGGLRWSVWSCTHEDEFSHPCVATVAKFAPSEELKAEHHRHRMLQFVLAGHVPQVLSFCLRNRMGGMCITNEKSGQTLEALILSDRSVTYCQTLLDQVFGVVLAKLYSQGTVAEVSLFDYYFTRPADADSDAKEEEGGDGEGEEPKKSDHPRFTVQPRFRADAIRASMPLLLGVESKLPPKIRRMLKEDAPTANPHDPMARLRRNYAMFGPVCYANDEQHLQIKPKSHQLQIFPMIDTYFEDVAAASVAFAPEKAPCLVERSFVHGNLRAGNVLVKDRERVCLVEFDSVHLGHILRDFAQLENDILYVHTVLDNDDELGQALDITVHLYRVKDLSVSLPPSLSSVTSPKLIKAWKLIVRLRYWIARLHLAESSPRHLAAALLHNAVATLRREDISEYQAKWALASACCFAQLFKKRKAAPSRAAQAEEKGRGRKKKGKRKKRKRRRRKNRVDASPAGAAAGGGAGGPVAGGEGGALAGGGDSGNKGDGDDSDSSDSDPRRRDSGMDSEIGDSDTGSSGSSGDDDSDDSMDFEAETQRRRSMLGPDRELCDQHDLKLLFYFLQKDGSGYVRKTDVVNVIQKAYNTSDLVLTHTIEGDTIERWVNRQHNGKFNFFQFETFMDVEQLKTKAIVDELVKIAGRFHSRAGERPTEPRLEMAVVFFLLHALPLLTPLAALAAALLPDPEAAGDLPVRDEVWRLRDRPSTPVPGEVARQRRDLLRKAVRGGLAAPFRRYWTLVFLLWAAMVAPFFIVPGEDLDVAPTLMMSTPLLYLSLAVTFSMLKFKEGAKFSLKETQLLKAFEIVLPYDKDRQSTCFNLVEKLIEYWNATKDGDNTVELTVKSVLDRLKWDTGAVRKIVKFGIFSCTWRRMLLSVLLPALAVVLVAGSALGLLLWGSDDDDDDDDSDGSLSGSGSTDEWPASSRTAIGVAVALVPHAIMLFVILCMALWAASSLSKAYVYFDGLSAITSLERASTHRLPFLPFDEPCNIQAWGKLRAFSLTYFGSGNAKRFPFVCIVLSNLVVLTVTVVLSPLVVLRYIRVPRDSDTGESLQTVAIMHLVLLAAVLCLALRRGLVQASRTNGAINVSIPDLCQIEYDLHLRSLGVSNVHRFTPEECINFRHCAVLVHKVVTMAQANTAGIDVLRFHVDRQVNMTFLVFVSLCMVASVVDAVVALDEPLTQ